MVTSYEAMNIFEEILGKGDKNPNDKYKLSESQLVKHKILIRMEKVIKDSRLKERESAIKALATDYINLKNELSKELKR